MSNWPAPNAAEWEPMPCYSCGSLSCKNFDYCDKPHRAADLHPIVELLDQITDEFLQADGKDMFHVGALADLLRQHTDRYPSGTDETWNLATKSKSRYPSVTHPSEDA